MTAVGIILIALLFCSLFLAFKFGYEKGIHDLTEEIDEGIQRIQRQKHYDSLREENDSD